MKTSYPFRTLRVAGPLLADGTALWDGLFDVVRVPAIAAARGVEGVVRNYAARVLAQEAQPRVLHISADGAEGDVRFHLPTLIDADLRLVPDGDSRGGDGVLTITGATEQVRTEPNDTSWRVRLAPIGAWPEKASVEIEAPAMRMVGGEVRVPLRAGSRLAHVLGLRAGPWTPGTRITAFGPDSGMTVAVDAAAGPGSRPRVWISLVAGGVRIDAEAQDPFDGRFGNTPAPLALTLLMRPRRDEARLDLEVVCGSGEGALRARVTALARALGEPGPLRLSVAPGVAPLAWPLSWTSGSWQAKRLTTRLAGDKVQATLLSEPPSPGLPPQVAEFRPDTIAVTADGPSLTATVTVGRAGAGARCALAWTGHSLELTALTNETGTDLTVFADTTALRSGLVRRYVAQGLRDEGSDGPVYAFLPLARGFLQAALPPPKPVGPAVTTPVAHAALAGAVRVQAPSWTVVIDAASSVSVKARIEVSSLHVDVALTGAQGQADGLIWACATAPEEGDVLPSLAGGPAALEAAPCLIGRDGTSGFRLGLSGVGATLRATVVAAEPATPDPPLVAWLAHPTLALAQSMPMTRFAPGPSTTRDLAPRAVAFGAVLTWPTTAGWPELDRTTLRPASDIFDWPWQTTTEPDAETAEDDAVPMVVVTLPGVEAAPDPARGDMFASLSCSLRFDLPVLGELFAGAALSDDAKAEPPPAATAVEPETLPRFFARQARLLALSRTMGDRATSWVPLGGSRSVVIRDLARPSVWTTPFEVTDAVRGGPPLGAFRLGRAAPWRAGGTALQGFTGPVTLDGGEVVDVVGFAIAMRRDGDFRIDARGHGLADRPQAAGALTLRDSRGEGGVRRLLLTIAALEVAPGLAFAARDLPIARKAGGLFFDATEADTAGELLREQDGDAFRRQRFGAGLMEWRLFDTTAVPAFTIPFGQLLCLRPLRLVTATVAADGGSLAELTIAALVELPKRLVDGQGPFMDDAPYADGTLVQVTWQNGSLVKVASARAGGAVGAAGPVRIAFPIDARGPQEELPLTLAATLGVLAGAPTLDEITLQGRLFGAATQLTGGVWSAGGISFAFAAGEPINALAVEKVTLDRQGDGWLLTATARARIGLQAAGAAAGPYLATIAADGTLGVFDTDLPDGTCSLDHGRGVVAAAHEPKSATLTVARGLVLAGEIVRAQAALALAVPDGPVTRAANADFAVPLSAGLVVFEAENASLTLRLSSDARGLTCSGAASVSLNFAGRESRVGWPLGTVTGVGGPAMLRVSSTDAALVHRVTPVLVALPLPLEKLRRDSAQKLFVDLAVGPWLARVACRHEMRLGTDSILDWRSLDEIAIFDWKALRATLATLPPRSRRAHAFAPRYREDSRESGRIASAGIVERSLARAGFPPFALTARFAGNATKSVGDCLVVSGASLCDLSFADGDGVTLALPWFAPLDDGADSGLLAVPQRPVAGSIAIAVAAPDAISWRPPGVPATTFDAGSGSAAEVGRALAAMGAVPPATMLGDPAFASDARDVPTSSQADQTQNTAARPVYVRALISLVRLITLTRTHGKHPVAALLLGKGGALRLLVRPPLSTPVLPMPSVRELIALTRTGLTTEPSEDAPAHQVLRSARVPLALLLATREIDGAPLYREVETHAAPRFDDGAQAARQLRAAATWTGSSPALGWPTRPRMPPTQTPALAIGPETPIQDETAVWAGRGRIVASARIAAPPASETIFLTFGRRTLFARPGQIGLRAPPDEALVPAPPRVRAPRQAALVRALNRIGVTSSAPILPGAVEIVASGGRPGVLGLDLHGLVVAGDDEPFDAEFERFGRAAHRAPVLAAALRVPRSGPYVADADLATRRRTFVAENFVAGTEPVLGLAAQGAMTLLRATESRFTGGTGMAWTGVRILCGPGDLVLDERWNGVLKLSASAPGIAGARLREWLARQGLREGARADLTVGSQRFPFAVLTAAAVAREDDLELTLTMADPAAEQIRRLLAEGEPDLRLGLSVRLAAGSGGAWPGGTDQIALKQDHELEPELPAGPPIILSLPLQRTRTDVAAPRPGLITLAFGDPAYDRALGSATKSEIARADGKSFLLALDRAEYDRDATIFLAVGALLTPPDASPRFGDEPPGEWHLSVELLPAPRPGIAMPKPQFLALAGVAVRNDPKGSPVQRIPAGQAVALPLAALVAIDETGTRPADIRPGDRIAFSASRATPVVELRVEVGISAEPVFAAPDAVYAAIGLDAPATSAQTTFFASAPMPDMVEFLDLDADLAVGRVRRRALFVWTAPRTRPLAHMAIVKLDGAGGGQTPDGTGDFLPIAE